jgi:hypothetical protein
VNTKVKLVAQLTPTRRVVEDGLQWIVRDHFGGKWRNIAYCRQRDTILDRFMPQGTPQSMAKAIEGLPARLSTTRLTIPWL